MHYIMLNLLYYYASCEAFSEIKSFKVSKVSPDLNKTTFDNENKPHVTI